MNLYRVDFKTKIDPVRVNLGHIWVKGHPCPGSNPGTPGFLVHMVHGALNYGPTKPDFKFSVEASARTMDITEDDEPPMRATMPIDTPDEIPAEDAEEAAEDAPEDAPEDAAEDEAEAEAEEEAAEDDDGQIFV